MSRPGMTESEGEAVKASYKGKLQRQAVRRSAAQKI